MIQKLKRRLFGEPQSWMYSDECQNVGCEAEQSGLEPEPTDAEYCEDCAEYKSRLAKVRAAVLSGELEAHHVAHCPNDCTNPRPRLIAESWGQEQPEAASCAECGAECAVVEESRHEVEKA